MKLFDANMYAGRPVKAVPAAAGTPDELARAMDSAGISRALVWHITQHDFDAVSGNDAVSRLTAGSERLAGCWTVLPPQTGEAAGPGLFGRMAGCNIKALRAFPARHNYLLNRAVFGGFFDAAAEAGVPLLLSLKYGSDWPGIYSFMSEYPSLTVILCDVGIWGQDRMVWPLLEKYENLFVETSLVSLEAGGLEAGVSRFGAGRFVYGSGFPDRYPEASMLDLLNSRITREDKERVAGVNLEKILEGARID